MCRTPASLINPDRNVETATDMIILFDDCVDFDGPTSDGWNLVSSIESDDIYAVSKHDIFYGILSYLFRKFHAELNSSIDAGSIYICLYFAMNRSDMKNVRLILDFDPKAMNYSGNTIYDIPAIHLVATLPYIHVDILKLLLEKGADFQITYLGETATSRSLWFSKLFFTWLKRLQDIYQDLDEFMERETSPGSVLGQANWDCRTLRDLLNLDSNEIFNDLADDSLDVQCYSCWKYEFGGTRKYVIEPWWEELKHKVRNTQCICSLLMGTKNRFINEKIRQMSLEKTKKNSEFHAGESDLDYDIESKESQGEYGFTRQGNASELLWRFSHIHGGRWNKHYIPNEYYCFECLEVQEGWGPGSDTETSSSIESEQSVD